MFIHAGSLAAVGIPLRGAIRAGVVLPLTDDADLRDALVAACLP